jgi:ketosteroid isomerase-like protein
MPSRRADQPAVDVEKVVRRYFDVVADLSSTEEDLRPLLDPDLCVVEHPNAVTPRGAVRGVAETVAGFRSGKALLKEQSFDVHEILTVADRVAIRATWKGTIGVDAGPYRLGQGLVAHVAALITVRHGRVLHHETFDCYDPIKRAP